MASLHLPRRMLPTSCSSNNAQQQARREPSTGPRGVSKRVLLTGTLLAAAVAIPAQPSQGASMKENQCVMQTTDEEAEACRLAILEADAGKKQDYGAASTRTFNTAGGVPVADMSDKYTAETLALYESIVKYGTLDPYDKARPPLIKSLKADCANWVSQYARGGSARKQSARKFYVAVDAVSGHLSSNGLAPFPARKFLVVQSNMKEALVFLSDGK